MDDRLAEIDAHWSSDFNQAGLWRDEIQQVQWLIAEVKRLRAQSAAAPARYEALKRIVALSEDDEHEPTYAWKEAFEAAAVALAIAEGEAH